MCTASLHRSPTSLERKAGSQLVRSESLQFNGCYTFHPAGGSTCPFLLLKNVAEMYAEVAQSILIFFFIRVNLVSEYFWKGDVPKKPLL